MSRDPERMRRQLRALGDYEPDTIHKCRVVVDGIYTIPEIAREAERVIAELSSANEWRDIETAPKDGTPILVARWSDIYGWVLGHSQWVRIGRHPDRIEGWLSDGFSDIAGDLGLAHPTHWLHLPAAPESPVEAEGEKP